MRNRTFQLACAGGGIAAAPIALLALFGSGVMPPKAANSSAPEIAAFYGHHSDLKVAGLFVGFCAVSLLAPLVAMIGLRMFRIEGRNPAAAFVQLTAGTVTCAFLAIPLLILFATAFRPERNPEITQALHDLGWILFLVPIAPFIIQNVAIAAGILGDRNADPVYPRWVAWANLAIAASFVPDALLGFFRSGPFAYQGALSFWIPTVTYGLWLNIMAFTTIRAIRREAVEDAPDAATADTALQAA